MEMMKRFKEWILQWETPGEDGVITRGLNLEEGVFELMTLSGHIASMDIAVSP